MRLIDADKLIEVLNKKSVPFNANVNDAILTAPTVEGIEIRRRGAWVYGNGNGECPFCKRERQLGWDNFCGFCGAYMKGERKEE